MTDIVIVRHGETVWHAENRYAGSSDIALTERGEAQAEALAAWASTADLAGLWVSPLVRAAETARGVERTTGLVARTDERLRELDFGRAEGLTTSEMGERFPHELDAFRADPVGHHLPDGEDPVKAAARFSECLRDVAEHTEGRVLVVAHTTVLRLSLCDLLGIDLAHYRRVFPFVLNCALNEVRLSGGTASLLRLNAPAVAGPA